MRQGSRERGNKRGIQDFDMSFFPSYLNSTEDGKGILGFLESRSELCDADAGDNCRHFTYRNGDNCLY